MPLAAFEITAWYIRVVSAMKARHTSGVTKGLIGLGGTPTPEVASNPIGKLANQLIYELSLCEKDENGRAIAVFFLRRFYPAIYYGCGYH